MPIPSSVEHFLKSVQKTAQDFEAIWAGNDLIDLLHPFWSYQRVSDSLSIKEEWDVADDLIPFYGDWHTLMCISGRTGEVFLLDDERTAEFVWRSADDFLDALTHEKPSENEPPHKKPVLVKATYSDELTRMIEHAKREDAHRRGNRKD